MFVSSLRNNQSFLKILNKMIKKLRNREKSLKNFEKMMKNYEKCETYEIEPPKNVIEGGSRKTTPPYASPPS